MLCTTPFNTPSKQATIPAGETVTVDLPTEGDRHFALYRLSIGSDAIEDLYVEDMSLPGKHRFLGGDFPSVTGAPDGRIHLSLLQRFFRFTQLHRPVIVEPNRPLRLKVTNASGDTEHTVSFTPHGVHLSAVPAGYVPPRFLHTRAQIAGEASDSRVLIPPDADSLVFDRYLLAADSAADVTLNVLVAGVPVREFSYLEQINHEFELFRLPMPHAIPAHGQVILEITNANAEAQYVSILAEAWTPATPLGTHALDAPSHAHIVGPVFGMSVGPPSAEPQRPTTPPVGTAPSAPSGPASPGAVPGTGPGPGTVQTLPAPAGSHEPCLPGQRCAAPGWTDPGATKPSWADPSWADPTRSIPATIKPTTSAGGGGPFIDASGGLPSGGLDCLVPPCPGDGYPQAADLNSVGAAFGLDWLYGGFARG